MLIPNFKFTTDLTDKDVCAIHSAIFKIAAMAFENGHREDAYVWNKLAIAFDVELHDRDLCAGEITGDGCHHQGNKERFVKEFYNELKNEIKSED